MFDPDNLDIYESRPRPKLWVEFVWPLDAVLAFLRRVFRARIVPVAAAFVVCGLLGAGDALAADIFCGHDDDEGGTATACTGLDADHDGYTTDGTPGHAGDTAIDCDDTDWQIGLDAWVDAGGGQVKRCKADGTYTTAVAVSALVASDIASTCTTLKFIDDAGSTSGGCGAYGSPCDPRCLVDSGRACYVAPSTSNDCFWWLPGTYGNNATATDSGVASLFLISNKDGSAAHPIVNVADPTGTVLLDSPGTTNANKSRPLQLNDSDYWKFYGFHVGNGYSDVGVYFSGGSNDEFYYGKVYSVDGCAETCGNNVAGVTFNGGDNNILRATLLKDNFDPTSSTANNWRLNTGIVMFAGTGNQVLFNSFTNSSTETPLAIKNKHGEASATLRVIGNHISKFYENGIVWNEGGATIERNYISFTNPNTNAGYCLGHYDTGVNPYWDTESTVKRNICINAGLFFGSRNRDTAGSYADPYFTLQYNLTRDGASSYALEDGAHHSIIEECYRCTDGRVTTVTGKFDILDNCYYNTGAVALLFSFAGDATGASGSNYASFGLWTAAGYDAGSFSESFTVNSDGSVGTSSNCADFGAFGDADATTTTTTSTSTTTTTSSTTSSTTTTTTTSSVPNAPGRGRARS